MAAITLNSPARRVIYGWGEIDVRPDPPRLGEVTEMVFPLRNSGATELVVERIDIRIARFGMGMPWETLQPIGPFTLPANPERVLEASVQWQPDLAGHRCIRASIYLRGETAPVQVGRNLHVLSANEEDDQWSVAFLLGNPTGAAAPVLVRQAGDTPLMGTLLVEGRDVPAGRPIKLMPGEAVAAELLLRAAPGPALAAEYRVETFIHGQFIDGMLIEVRRPALSLCEPGRRQRDSAGTRQRDADLVLASCR